MRKVVKHVPLNVIKKLRNISSNVLNTYLVLANSSNNVSACLISNDTLSGILNQSKSDIKKNINILIKKGFIASLGKLGQANIYVTEPCLNTTSRRTNLKYYKMVLSLPVNVVTCDKTNKNIFITTRPINSIDCIRFKNKCFYLNNDSLASDYIIKVQQKEISKLKHTISNLKNRYAINFSDISNNSHDDEQESLYKIWLESR